MHYAARHMLPTRRLSLYLAQVAMVTAKSAGNKDLTLTDFLFSPVEDDPEDDLEAAIEYFDFNPQQ